MATTIRNPDLTTKSQLIRIDSVLAALVLASIPWGPALALNVDGKTLSISFSQFATIALALHIVNTKLVLKDNTKSGLAIAIGLAALMLPPLLLSPLFGSGLFAFANYALGVIGGMTVGSVWAQQHRARMGAVDLGLVVFLVTGSAQLLNAFANAGSIKSLHQNAETPWGNSNYVAAALIVGALILGGRVIQVRGSWWNLLPIVTAVTSALMTLSRGAAVAGA